MRLGWALLAACALVPHLWGLYSPAAPGPPLSPGMDKVLHAASFLSVALPLRMAGVPALWVLALGVGHAALSEWIQHAFIAGRTGDPLDAAADVLGVLLALALTAALRAVVRRFGR